MPTPIFRSVKILSETKGSLSTTRIAHGMCDAYDATLRMERQDERCRRSPDVPCEIVYRTTAPSDVISLAEHLEASTKAEFDVSTVERARAANSRHVPHEVEREEPYPLGEVYDIRRR